jgi:hypothetical protein
MSKSIWRRSSKPLIALVICVLLGGCGGENVSLPKKIEFVLDRPPDDYKETRKAFSRKGASARMKGDPSGISKE